MIDHKKHLAYLLFALAKEVFHMPIEKNAPFYEY
jgi:hypothetical protein